MHIFRYSKIEIMHIFGILLLQESLKYKK